MVDPARVVAVNLGIDHLPVIQAKIECVRIVLVVGSGFPRGALASVFNNASAFGNELSDVYAATVYAGLANVDPYGSLSSFVFLCHGGRKEWERQLRIRNRNGETKKIGNEN